MAARMALRVFPAFRRRAAKALIPDFRADAAYRATLPDLQNGPASLIRGARRTIQHVGIAGFRLPIRYRRRDGDPLTLETSVTGTVSLEAGKKGINMSRIMRSFYAHADATFSFEVIEAALDDYKADLESFDARIQMRCRFPMKVESLRSGLEGYQYYDIALEWSTGAACAPHRASRLCLFLDLPLFAGTERACARDPQSSWRRRIRSARSRGCRSNWPSDATLWFEDLIDLAAPPCRPKRR
jgi:GTP cyclohydrolase I